MKHRLTDADVRARVVRLALIAVVASLVSASGPATAAVGLGDQTISIAGTFPSHVIGPHTAAAPGDPSTYTLKATVEIRGQLLVYGTGDGRFETRIDGTTATSTSPASCNDALTNTPRRSTTRAWIAGGMLIVVRFSEATFPGSGPCRGITESQNETFGLKLNNGTCTFGYTGVHTRGGVKSTVTIVDQRCETTMPAGQSAPKVAQAPAPVCKDVPAGASTTLRELPQCLALYCAEIDSNADESAAKTKENLRHIDDKLSDLRALMAATTTSLQKADSACRALGNACEKSKLDSYKTASQTHAINSGKLSDLYDSLQRFPEEDIILKTGESMIRIFGDQGCAKQIYEKPEELLGAAQDLMLKSEKMVCRAPAISRCK